MAEICEIGGVKLIEKQWLSYREMVIPKNAPLVQLQECRRAFYAGAEGLLRSVFMAALDPGNEVTGKDLKLMADVDKELTDFAAAVSAGVK